MLIHNGSSLSLHAGNVTICYNVELVYLSNAGGRHHLCLRSRIIQYGRPSSRLYWPGKMAAV